MILFAIAKQWIAASMNDWNLAEILLVILSLSTWCLGVDGLMQRNPVHCFLNSQALHSWRQQWLTSDWLITAPVQSAGHNNSRRAQGVDKGCSNKTCRMPGWATINNIATDAAEDYVRHKLFTALRRTPFAVRGAMWRRNFTHIGYFASNKGGESAWNSCKQHRRLLAFLCGRPLPLQRGRVNSGPN